MERIPQARDRSSGSRWTQCRIVVNTILLWTLRIVSQLLVLVGVAVLFYGSVRFAGGLIVAAHGRYYGDGQPPSYADFHAFQLWQTTMLLV
jgi:hypothetical protein